MGMQALIDSVGTGKTFMVTYGKFGRPIKVYCIDVTDTHIFLGYTDQTSLWINKDNIRKVTADDPKEFLNKLADLMDEYRVVSIDVDCGDHIAVAFEQGYVKIPTCFVYPADLRQAAKRLT